MLITTEMARSVTEQRANELIDFTQRIVATPSLSGWEGEVAALIVAELKKLTYDEVWTDEVGNIIGKINGDAGPTILLNGHMDIVDPGPAAGWPHPAYSGEIVDGNLWGRGSVDMKGPVAAMIYGAAQFKQLNLCPLGDILMTIAVMEEIGGLGSQAMVRQFLADDLKVDAAIVGEPSQNTLRLGHRGRIELQVKFPGRSAHASAPDLAINPHFAAAEFIRRLNSLELGHDPVLGHSTIAPTLYLTDQQSANVIPGEVTLFLDWRNVPKENREFAVKKLTDLLHACLAEDSYRRHVDPIRLPTVKVTEQPMTTYTGAVKNFASVFPPFSIFPDSALAQATAKVIAETTGQSIPADVWQFATDGGHLVAAGIPTIGFGPGDDRLAHTNQERISIADLKTATATYARLIEAMGKSVATEAASHRVT